MSTIYSKTNIFERLLKTKEYLFRTYKESYSTSDLHYGFNGLEVEEQDSYLKGDSQEYFNNLIRKGAIDAKRFNIVDVKLFIKNPEYRKMIRQMRTPVKVSDVKQGRIILDGNPSLLKDVLDSSFGFDEQEVIKLKYSEEPPLTNTEVAFRKCIDISEVNEITTKLYKKTYSLVKKDKKE